jgi:hypothetical protein
MKTYFHQTTEARSKEVCVSPVVGAKVPDYIVELLDESAAEEVEDHMLVCLHCKERYLTVLRLRGAVHRAETLCCDEDKHAPDDVYASGGMILPGVSDHNVEH